MNAVSRKVLMVAYHYPPCGVSSGIQRTLKFSAYLRELGWEPIVLTVDPRAYERVSQGQMADIPADLQVHRVFALDTARQLSLKGRYLRRMAIPDRWVSWWPAGVWRGLQIIRDERPAAIFSTFPIATAHLIARSLARRSGLPWIADFRDNMTDAEFPRDPLTWRFNRKLEASCVHECTKALFTTPGALQMYAERYADLPASRWHVIENGFDEENFRDAEAGFEPKPLGAPGQLTLVHSGVLYPEERDPRPFFAALARLKTEGVVRAANLQVLLRATGSDAYYAPQLKELGIADIVKLAPPVDYREALREMLCADGLLLLQAAMCNHQIPAKLYEYLRAGRPVLALTDPAGNTAASLRSAGCERIADLADSAAIEAELRRFLADHAAGRLQGCAPQQAALHSRRSRSSELAALLQEVCGAA